MTIVPEPHPSHTHRCPNRVLPLYAATLLLSATLLFLVQPMLAKMVLPLLGGTPEVWNTCMVFFQAALLAGYGYAHLSTRWLGVRRQAALHLVLLVAPLLWLPLALPRDASAAADVTPSLWLLGLLAATAGAPFLAVATTAPLLQRWFAETGHKAAADPYFLYAASNVGSMAALVAFPLVVEPNLRLAEQAWLWSGGYLVLVAMVAACAIALLRAPRESQIADRESTTRLASPSNRDSPRLAPSSTTGRAAHDAARKSRAKPQRAEAPYYEPEAPSDEPIASPPSWPLRLRWLALALVPSSWLLGVTTYLTTDIAPVPLLWVVPLALYLLSFVLVFARRPLLPHVWLVRLFPVVLLLLVQSILLTARWPVLALHLLAFFWGALVCHGELVRLRPHASHLTEFYLWMSLGGVLGGVANALVAPLVFPWLMEYPLAPVLAGLLVPAPAMADSRGDRWLRLAMLGLVLAVLALNSTALAAIERPVSLVMVVGAGTLAAALAYVANKPRWVALAVAAPLMMDQIAPSFSGEVLFTGRSYFGVHRVMASRDEQGRAYHHLVHGVTVHGRQARWSERECDPLTYYHRNGPLGEAFAAMDRNKKVQSIDDTHGTEVPYYERRVAIVGLGSGAMACYCDATSAFTFFEIDPLVRHIAQTPEYFSYLGRCAKGKLTVALGDGRLKLAASPDGAFDLIVLDAFSSDAVPVHLLTREAMEIYLKKLAPHGVILFHVSNQHLDLERVLADVAGDLGLVAFGCVDDRISPEEFAAGRTPSTYVAIARDAQDLGRLAASSRWRKTEPRPGGRGWTDDYSNILSALR